MTAVESKEIGTLTVVDLGRTVGHGTTALGVLVGIEHHVDAAGAWTTVIARRGGTLVRESLVADTTVVVQ